MLAFSDGDKSDGMPGLVARPLAFVLLTLVVNAETGVRDLTTEQIRRLYGGTITNWKQIGGRDVPVRLISRNPGSGTRAAFQRRVLGGVREPGSNPGRSRHHPRPRRPPLRRTRQPPTLSPGPHLLIHLPSPISMGRNGGECGGRPGSHLRSGRGRPIRNTSS
uniref:substrate-binding domain-containing protein n=1 Tax=Paractinoplanes polyasparticus TaxID=2856853 RepID=UPI001C8523CF|nr:substrate-binding domain-containing protein [Actinoplanes polyasparticus]